MIAGLAVRRIIETRKMMYFVVLFCLCAVFLCCGRKLVLAVELGGGWRVTSNVNNQGFSRNVTDIPRNIFDLK